MTLEKRLSLSLLLLRLGVGIVFFMWTLDKFLNPGHAAAVFEKFYMVSGLGTVAAYSIGALQAVAVIAFILGAFRSVSYLIILLMHSVSTLSTYANYLNPWEKPNLLFFAAFPMLAACITLWLLRKYDTITFDGMRE